jgi:hypothetical protein
MLNDLENRISESQDVLDEYKQQIRGQKELVRYYKNKGAISQNDKASAPADDSSKIMKVLEDALCENLKGKHNSTNAKVLMDAIFHGNMLNGEVAKLVNEKIQGHIFSIFCPWRLVKAGDVSAVGAFKSSTIQALRNVIDENNDGLFPSVSAVCWARSLLDKHGSEVMGWKKQQTKY